MSLTGIVQKDRLANCPHCGMSTAECDRIYQRTRRPCCDKCPKGKM